ncbi:hypothetical protein U6A24_20370 [Aquimarina gracilis]|uniref:Uncharacterized protein n=1 Tax=Aquimarina gracilis TaxID=874422 RepID=A0ABU6A107_9FLAO|nr:hypothetical protein [Aquimarina gracilis]MEB3347844.1 hypothetical protein [Aquimarina gracilis]
MWISVKEHIIEEREFNLLTQNCSSGKVLLQLIRRDVQASFFLFPKKVTELICTDTGKHIKKSDWTTEIKETAEEMRRNLKVPTWGYWSFATITLTILLAVSIGFYSEIKSTAAYQDSFMAKNRQEQKIILQQLGEGDLIATMKKVYQIKTINTNYVVLIESENPRPENYTEVLTNEAYPNTSFTDHQIEIPKSVFVNGMISNTDMILNVLDN